MTSSSLTRKKSISTPSQLSPKKTTSAKKNTTEPTMKVVINSCYGGFSLSDKALDMYKQLSNKYEIYDFELDRTDPVLIQIVETLGAEANGRFAKLRIIEIPDDVEWEITEYDGNESVEEVHRKWF